MGPSANVPRRGFYSPVYMPVLSVYIQFDIPFILVLHSTSMHSLSCSFLCSIFPICFLLPYCGTYFDVDASLFKWKNDSFDAADSEILIGIFTIVSLLFFQCYRCTPSNLYARYITSSGPPFGQYPRGFHRVQHFPCYAAVRDHLSMISVPRMP